MRKSAKKLTLSSTRHSVAENSMYDVFRLVYPNMVKDNKISNKIASTIHTVELSKFDVMANNAVKSKSHINHGIKMQRHE